MAMGSLYGMKGSMVPIDRAGRIVLPKDVRQELGIKPGDTLEVSIHGSSVTLTANRETVGFVRKGQALVFSTSGEETLSRETVRRIVEEGLDERHGKRLIPISSSFDIHTSDFP
jgi:AbrB family looped-hinge helix DNA binding protein